MDQNNGETPNPLNPNPSGDINNTPAATEAPREPISTAASSASLERPVAPHSAMPRMNTARPVGSVPRRAGTVSRTIDVAAVRRASAASRAVNTAPQSETNIDSQMADITSQGIDVASQTVNNAPQDVNTTLQAVGTTPQALVTEVKSQHKNFKKKSLIIGGIIAAFLAVGCGIVAALLLLNHREDPVSMAVQKLMEGGYSKNLTINGTVDINIKDNSSDITSLGFRFDSQVVGGSAVNSTNATVIAVLKNLSKPIEISVGEVYSNAGDLYLKVDDLRKSKVVDCQSGSDCEVIDYSTSILASLDDTLEVIDGKWIKIPSGDSNQLFKDVDGSGALNCAASFVGNVNNDINSLATIYKNNSFAFSSEENIPIARKDSPVYRVMIDSERFTNFTKSAQELSTIDNLLACVGYDGRSFYIDSMKNLPPLYVEVDEQYQFTRLYFEYDDDNIALTADLGLDYPDKPVITEPVEYQDYNIILQQLEADEEDTEAETTSD